MSNRLNKLKKRLETLEGELERNWSSAAEKEAEIIRRDIQVLEDHARRRGVFIKGY